MEVLPSEVAVARSFSTEDVKSLNLQYKQLQVDLHGILTLLARVLLSVTLLDQEPPHALPVVRREVIHRVAVTAVHVNLAIL